MIEVQGLTKVYGEFTAVKDLSFSVAPGEVWGLVGPNGAGKTTTLRCVTGIIPPTGGTVRLDGHDLLKEPLAAKRTLAYFPDEPRLFDHLTVWQHLVFIGRLYDVTAADFAARAEPLLTELALTDKRHELPSQLSRGMKQKVALACGLLHQPKCVVFDEPLTGLDPVGIRSMKATIRRMAHEGAAIILSSHLLSLLEEVCSHVLIVKAGSVVTEGSLADIRQKFANGAADVSLEDVFFKATADAQPAPPSPAEGP